MNFVQATSAVAVAVAVAKTRRFKSGKGQCPLIFAFGMRCHEGDHSRFCSSILVTSS